MAETPITPIIPNTILPITPNLSADISSLDAVGQNKDVNGNFNVHLDESIKTADVESGERLPIVGKSLPQTLGELKSSLQSLTHEFKLNDIDSSVSLEAIAGTLEREVEAKLADLPHLSNLLSEANTKTPISVKFSEISSISDSLEDVVSAELIAANHAIADLNVAPLTAPTQVTLAALHPVQINCYVSPIPTIENQNIFASAIPSASPDELEIQQNLFNNAEIDSEVESFENYSAIRKIDKSGDVSEKLNDIMTKYLSEDISSKTNFKSLFNSVDIFQQNVSSLKPESTLQNVNIATVTDIYASLSTGSMQSKQIEAPIPLFIKHGISSEQVQQNVDQSLTQNVKWLIGNKTQNAKINVFPESLGQINIALNLEDSNLKLNFIASSHVTKELIEASISALRNHFSESGINLQEVNIETQFSEQANEGSQESNDKEEDKSSLNSSSNSTTNDVDDLLLNNPHTTSTPLYLLDAYA